MTHTEYRIVDSTGHVFGWFPDYPTALQTLTDLQHTRTTRMYANVPPSILTIEQRTVTPWEPTQ